MSLLARTAWLEETQKEQSEAFLDLLDAVGEVRQGVVSSVVNFGAFVDLGGMDGLIHVSELSWKHVDHPSSVVQVGDEVTVKVIDVDMDKERMSLSLKATQQRSVVGIRQPPQGRRTRLRTCHRAPSRSATPIQVGEGVEGLDATFPKWQGTTSKRRIKLSYRAKSCG